MEKKGLRSGEQKEKHRGLISYNNYKYFTIHVSSITVKENLHFKKK